MSLRQQPPTAARCVAAAAGCVLAGYAAYAGMAWYRYGQITRPHDEDRDVLLDRFMPAYEVVERHHVRVHAPAAVVLEAAFEQDLQQSAIIRSIFKARELVLGATPDEVKRPRGLIAFCRSLGWGVLADETGHEIVMGAVTQPWVANVVFRPIAPGRFASFDEPDYVKIVWTLRADSVSDRESIFRTETRVATTDAGARAKFRRYWAFASPGIGLIRWLSLGPLKRDAERRARIATADELAARHTVRHSTQKPQNSQNRTGFSAGSASSALIVVVARPRYFANSAGTAVIGRIRMSR
jgi:hypothetical protein